MPSLLRASGRWGRGDRDLDLHTELASRGADKATRHRDGLGGIAGDRNTNEVLFEPSPETVLSYLLGHYLNIFMYRVLLEAKASEQSARMVSMKNATDSASGLIEDLTLEYNKLRQGNITKELLEIAGGQLGND